MRSIPLLLCAALLAGTATAGEVYRWTDAQGITHYSDTPPPRGTPHERINAPDPRPEAPASLVAGDGAAEAGAGRAAANAENCERARKNVRTLQDSPVVRMDTDGDGEMEELDQAQRAGQLEAAQRQVETFCGQ